jgi:hypothetical protein
MWSDGHERELVQELDEKLTLIIESALVTGS